MPKLPTDLGDRVIPQSNRSIASIANNANDLYTASARLSGTGGKAIGQGLTNLSAGLEKVQDARNELGYQEAKSKWLMAKVKEDNAYDDDPAYATYHDRYTQNLSKVRSDLMSGISDPKYRKAFELETAVDFTEGQVGIQSKASAKEKQVGIDNLNLLISNNMTAALNTKDEPTRAKLINSVFSAYDAAARANYISQADADMKKNAFRENYAVAAIQMLPPEEALGKLIPPQGMDTVGQPKGSVKQTALIDPKVEQIIGSYPANVLGRIAMIESSGMTTSANKYQFKGKTAEAYGYKDGMSESQQDIIAAKLLADNTRDLTSALGRAPTDAEQYLAWQQGVKGALALLADPQKPAIVALTSAYGGDLESARAAIIGNGGTENMTAGQFTNLWAAEYKGVDTTRIGDAVGSVGDVPAGGYDFSIKNGTVADFIPGDKRFELISKFTAQMKEQAQFARAGVQTEIQSNMDDWLQDAYVTGQVDPTRLAKIQWGYPDAQGVKYAESLAASAQRGNDFRAVASKSGDEIAAFVTGVVAGAETPGPGSSERAKRASDLLTAYKDRVEALNKDPAEYARSSSYAVEDAWTEFEAAPDNKELLQRAITLSMTEQQRLGTVAPTVYPKATREKIVSGIMSINNPKEQFATLMMFADTGNDDMSRAAIADLMSVSNGLPVGTDLILSRAIETGDIKGSETLFSKLMADTTGIELKAEDKNTIRSRVNDGIGGVLQEQAALSGNFASAAEIANPIVQAVEQIYKADPKTSISDTVKQLTDQFSIINDDGFAAVYYPSKYDTQYPDAIENGFSVIRSKFAEMYRRHPDPRIRAIGRDILDSSTWINMGNGFILMAPGGVPVASQRGLIGTDQQPLYVTMDDVIQAGLAAKADPSFGNKEWPFKNIPAPDRSWYLDNNPLVQ